VVAAREIVEFARHKCGASISGERDQFDVTEAVAFSSLRPGTVAFTAGAIGPDAGPDFACIVVARARVASTTALTVVTERPRLVFGEILSRFFADVAHGGIHRTAIIDESSVIGPGVSIGPYSLVGPDCVVGSHTTIGSHVVLARRVEIGRSCVIMSSAVIGEDGFGIEARTDGSLLRIPHIGGVQIHDAVRIGNFTAVASGTLEPTIIGAGTQIDNLVHVAHNVTIGKNCQIAASAEISGSAILSDEVYIAPRVAINQKLSIGARSLIGTGSTVTRSIPEDSIAYGSPAKVIRKRSE